MENAIIATQSVFFGICRWKNFENRLVSAEVTTKNKVAVFSGTLCIYEGDWPKDSSLNLICDQEISDEDYW